MSFPFLKKGNVYCFDDETGNVYFIDKDGEQSAYPLRLGLSGYPWLLLTDRKYLKKEDK